MSRNKNAQSDDGERKQASAGNPLLVFGGVVLLASLLALLIRGGIPLEKRGGLAPGNKAPVIRAAGWVNGTPPTPESLAGKVIVIDAWGSWCIPCRMQAPEMIKTYNRFKDQGVVFLGLTSEDGYSLPRIKEYIESTGIPWVNGYGAVETLVALEAERIPAVWVIDRSGYVTWNFDSPGTLDDAIEEALRKG